MRSRPGRAIRTGAGVGALAFLVLVVVGCDKKVYDPLPSPCCADPVQALSDAYRSRNSSLLASLLAPDFTFYRHQPHPDSGEQFWDLETELRIHRRMFDPRSIPMNDTPLSNDLWVTSINVTITPQAAFTERTDLYTTADPPGPLDPARWRAEDATYGTELFLALQGEDDYVVSGRANFVVLTDLTKSNSEPGRFLLYRIEDLGPTHVFSDGTQEIVAATWTGIKEMYR
jgi:hypothetical protein